MLQSKPHINRFLLPFSWLYGIVVWFRNKLFDWGALRSEEFPVPVISVGNITVGGTGKTPHIEYLIRLLSKDYKVAVLSRGYKRKSRDFVLAGAETSSKEIGDEPYQIHCKFPEITVAADRKRARGIGRLLGLEEDRRPDVILLDDAFQHRYVTPSYSIVLTDVNRLIYEDRLLPAGRLREPVSNKSRANMVIVTKCSHQLSPIDYRILSKHLDLYPYQSLFFTSWKYGALRPVFGEYGLPEMTLKDLKANKLAVLLLSGIANPAQLAEAVKPYAASIERMEYADHYQYSPADLVKLKKRFGQIPGSNKIIITTEKDAARIADRKDIDEEVRRSLYILPIEVAFTQNDSEDFNKTINEHVKTFRRNHFLGKGAYRESSGDWNHSRNRLG